MGNVFIGLIIGFALKPIKKLRHKTLQVILAAIIAVIATFIGIELVKSLIDSIVVSQPLIVRMGKNLTSFVSDAFVIVVSLPICEALDPYAQKLRYKK